MLDLYLTGRADLYFDELTSTQLSAAAPSFAIKPLSHRVTILCIEPGKSELFAA